MYPTLITDLFAQVMTVRDCSPQRFFVVDIILIIYKFIPNIFSLFTKKTLWFSELPREHA